MRSDRLIQEEVDILLRFGLRNRVFPGASWAIGIGDAHFSGAAGVLDPSRPDVPTSSDTIYDVASLTKIVSVWACVGVLVEQGRITLGTSLMDVFPEIVGRAMASVTVGNLLTHTAGLPLRSQLRELYGTSRIDIERGVLKAPLIRKQGTAVEYTDRAALILGFLVERLCGPLATVSKSYVWDPLGMNVTGFGPLSGESLVRVAPTEYDSVTAGHLKGVVHDYSARLLGGTCGVAGVFSTVSDLSLFARYLIDPASRPNSIGFGLPWISESLAVRTGNLVPSRGLFWHPAPGMGATSNIWSHYGFTGTAMWVCPARQAYGVLLTNRLFYSRERDPLNEIRESFCRIVFGE